jgi:hypothetical protein
MADRVLSSRLPRSGNAALASAAVIQAVLGAEFVLAGLNKTLDANYPTQFRGFVQGSPGANSGPLSALIQTLVVPNLDLVAEMSKAVELVAGGILLITAIEVLRRRLSGGVGAQHGYEPLLALVSALAAGALAGISLTIYFLEGGRLPTINPAYAFTSPIAVELLLVPLALGIAWIELARFFALRDTPSGATAS